MIAKPDSTSGDRGKQPCVVVIGGGFSGIMTAANVLRSASGPIHVILVEQQPTLGFGSAFAAGDPSHLLCEPTSNMGAYEDDRGGFARWCERVIGDHDPDGFRPRAEYARYLEATLACAAERAADNVTLTRLEDEVIDIRSLPGARHVELACHGPLYADHIVLALGNGPTRIPEALSDLMHESDRVSVAPCDPVTWSRISPRDRVLVLGTGLTMYDTAITLARQGFVGEMCCLSRHGLTPSPHRLSACPAWLNEWAASLSDVHPPSRIVRSVRAAIRRAEQRGEGWQAVLDAMRSGTQSIWARLDERCRAQCIAHLSPYWRAARSRCAPEVDAAISILRRHGILTVMAGRLLRASIRRGRLQALIQPRGSCESAVMNFDRAIVCTGLEQDVSQRPEHLLRSLIRSGLLTPDPLHLGVVTDDDSRAITRDGMPVPWLHVIGRMRQEPIGAGASVCELRAQACDIAAQLTRVFKSSPTGLIRAGAAAVRRLGEAQCTADS